MRSKANENICFFVLIFSILAHSRGESTYRNVTRFLLFVGHARTGHTLVGSIIDSHPNAIVANEADVLGRVLKKPEAMVCGNGYTDCDQTDLDKIRSFVTSVIVSNSKQNRNSGRFQTGYDYTIRVNKSEIVLVLGDKKGGMTTSLLLKNNGSLFDERVSVLQRAFGVPVVFFHVLRNPFDMIATQAFRNQFGHKVHFDSFKNVSFDRITKAVKQFVAGEEAIAEMKKGKYEVIDFFYEDLLDHTQKELERYAEVLNLPFSKLWRTEVEKLVYPTSHATRDLMAWPRDVYEVLKAFCEHVPLLSRYKSVYVQSANIQETK
mmetsp:Transcript_33228/g.93160  ORF Transcript_33228/g.93160 Transcript_33228/m.93160 type:complete len:320 (+) Transcript_33228:72-1031(+)